MTLHTPVWNKPGINLDPRCVVVPIVVVVAARARNIHLPLRRVPSLSKNEGSQDARGTAAVYL